MENVLNGLSGKERGPILPRVSRRVDGFSRNDVVNAFTSAFEIIGGINRLALWANANPDKFYPLYSKLLPATTQLIGDAGAIEIIHRIAPTKLDVHDSVSNGSTEIFEDVECRELSSTMSPDTTSTTSTHEISDGQFSLFIDEPERQSQP
jgi:hypothetical protein